MKEYKKKTKHIDFNRAALYSGFNFSIIYFFFQQTVSIIYISQIQVCVCFSVNVFIAYFALSQVSQSIDKIAQIH